jgi:predicted nucleic acid-binding protein
VIGVKIVVDTYTWVEIFRGSEEGRSAVNLLSKAMEVYTPSTVIAEIARKYLREGLSLKESRDRLKRISEVSQITGIDNEIALLSAEIEGELKHRARTQNLGSPSLFDAIVLGTARHLGCKVLTGDRHFVGLQDTIFLG